MNILLASDIHYTSQQQLSTYLKKCGNIDAFISLGDVDSEVLQKIAAYFGNIPMAGVLGNHDYFNTLTRAGISDANLKIRHLKEVSVIGLQGSIDYKQEDFPCYSQFDSIDAVNEIPKANVFISHSAPYGIHDDKSDDAHIGLMGITQYIRTRNPKYCIHGHMHEITKTIYNSTTVIGVYGLQVLNYETGEIAIMQ